MREFRLPDLGEGLTEGEILQWLVAVGDVITLNQPIVEVETAKAAVEVPSPYAGTVTELVHPAGATVDVGSVIIRISSPDVEDDASPGDPDDLVPAIAEPKREAVLVGYGVKQGAAVRRPRKTGPVVRATDLSVPAATPAAVVAPATERVVAGATRALAKPPVRKLARELGVDLAAIQPARADGVISRDEVLSAGGAVAGASSADHDRAGTPSRESRRIPVKGVRKLTAEAMVASAFTAPHVTLFMTVDVTETMRMVRRVRALPAFDGVKVSPLLFVARALLLACAEHPGINASWDSSAMEIVEHGGVNLGIAAATPRGLQVPNVKDADQLTIVGLARALQQLTETAKAGRTSPSDMSGGTITITNVGVFGVDNGTPILNHGEAAILCFGAVREQPWVHEGAIAIREVTQLSMAFDHRLVDGQLGSEALSFVGRALEDPTRLIDWG